MVDARTVPASRADPFPNVRRRGLAAIPSKLQLSGLYLVSQAWFLEARELEAPSAPAWWVLSAMAVSTCATFLSTRPSSATQTGAVTGFAVTGFGVAQGPSVRAWCLIFLAGWACTWVYHVAGVSLDSFGSAFWIGCGTWCVVLVAAWRLGNPEKLGEPRSIG